MRGTFRNHVITTRLLPAQAIGVRASSFAHKLRKTLNSLSCECANVAFLRRSVRTSLFDFGVESGVALACAGGPPPQAAAIADAGPDPTYLNIPILAMDL